jgi:hypothetical protein
MPEQGDPFTGTWRFNAQLSKLSTPSPRSWVQEIIASPDEVEVHENIVRPDGSQTVVTVLARFDGREYPASGSHAADTIAYTRVDRNSILGTGRKNGVITLTETVTVSPASQNLTLRYSILGGAEEVANGVAVFEKDA